MCFKDVLRVFTLLLKVEALIYWQRMWKAEILKRKKSKSSRLSVTMEI